MYLSVLIASSFCVEMPAPQTCLFLTIAPDVLRRRFDRILPVKTSGADRQASRSGSIDRVRSDPITPGRTSRTNYALTVSSTQVSDAKIQALSRLTMHNG